MWEYKVITGTYSIEPGMVKVRNPAGEGALQQILDHYGADRWEVVTIHLDVTQNAVMVLKRPKVGAGAPPMAAAAAAPMPTPVPPPMPVPGGYPNYPQPASAGMAPAYGGMPGYGQPAAAPPPPAMGGGGGGGGGRRRSKKDLDRLARGDD
jgi:hypothetical protein